MTLDKLKVAARQHEQREEWRAAIELYRQAIRVGEEASEGIDPYLFSRIGDLEQKAGDSRAACEAWEQAVGRYGDLGFSNNAIAICAKILRVDPTRARIHLELARFQGRKGMFHDASRDMRLYLERMQHGGHEEQARQGLLGLGEEFPRWEELQLLLDQLLGRDRTQQGPAAEGGAAPRAQGLVFIDTGPLTLERASEPDEAQPLGLEATVVEGIELERPASATLDGLEQTAIADVEPEPVVAEPGAVDGLIEMNRLAATLEHTPRIEGLEVGATSLEDGVVAPLDGLQPTVTALPDDLDGALPLGEAIPADDDDLYADDDDEPAAPAAPLVFLDESAPAAAPDPAPAIPAPAPDDPLGQRAAGHALLEIGDRAGGIAAFERALTLYQDREDWLPAWQTASELVAAEPGHIGHHQTRVEIASRLGDTPRRTEAYLDLGDALRRLGAEEKAIAVFRRVLEHDAENARANAALREMRPPQAAVPGEEGFVDLRSMLVDDGPRTTRMRTETTPVRADEDETFREALAEFKRALDENLPAEDTQAHYDLGVAFREMGLLDEAISSFQKALRSPEHRLRTSEALGQTFFEQGRIAVAEAVLRNAERGPEQESEKIGVLYWLGRALEAQQRSADALLCYQRVLAVDVLFMDVSDRLLQVSGQEGA